PIPSSPGFSSTASRICWLAASTADRRASTGALLGTSSSRCARAPMTMLLATSPAAIPPMPSATARSRGPAYTESWLPWRVRPRSLRAAYRMVNAMCGSRRSGLGGFVGWSWPQLEGRAADPDRHAEGYRSRCGDLGPVQVRPVGRAQVLDIPLPRSRYEPRVVSGSVVVGDHECGVLGPPDRDRALGEAQPGAGQRPLGHEHVVGRTSTLDLGRATSRRHADAPRRRDQAAAAGSHEKIATDHPDHCEYEDPQQDEEPEAGDSDDVLRQCR